MAASHGHDHADRCVGALLGVMAGDVLGAAVEGWSAQMIREKYGPDGLVDFLPCRHMGQPHDVAQRPKGMYTDDTWATLALAHSLVSKSGLDTVHSARTQAEFFRLGVPERYCPASASAVQAAILEGRCDPLLAGRLVFPEGSFANGGAMRIAPVGLAFARSGQQALRAAVQAAIVSTHCHPSAVDGATVQAAAVAFLARCPSVERFDPRAFLDHVRQACRTEDMAANVSALVKHYGKPRSCWPYIVHSFGARGGRSKTPAPAPPWPPVSPAVYTDSVPASAAGGSGAAGAAGAAGGGAGGGAEAAAKVTKSNVDDDSDDSDDSDDNGNDDDDGYDERAIGKERYGTSGFQIEATVAVASALWAFLDHFDSPELAIIGAVKIGGDTDTVASMCGALCGALHGGSAWMPKRWYDALENGEWGRDRVIAMAKELAALDLGAPVLT